MKYPRFKGGVKTPMIFERTYIKIEGYHKSLALLTEETDLDLISELLKDMFSNIESFKVKATKASKTLIVILKKGE